MDSYNDNGRHVRIEEVKAEARIKEAEARLKAREKEAEERKEMMDGCNLVMAKHLGLMVMVLGILLVVAMVCGTLILIFGQ